MSEVVIPLIVQDRATAALQSASNAAKGLDSSTAALNKQIQAASASTNKFAGEADKLASAVGMVSPRAAEVIRQISGMAKAAEVATQGSGALGLSMSSLLSIAGPVGIAMGVLGGVYLALAADLEAVDAANASAAATATAWADAARKQAAIVAKIGDDYAVATGAASTYDVEIRNLTGSLTQARDAERALLVARVAAAGSLHTPELVAAKQALADYDARTQELTDQIEVSTRTKEANAQADRNAAAAAKAHAAAQSALAASMAADQAEITAHVREAEAARKDEQAAAELRWKAESDALMSQIELRDKMTESVHRLVQEQEIAADQAAEAARQAKVEGRASGIAGAASGPSSVVSGIGNAGPWGAVVAALINLSGNLASVGDAFNDFTVNLNNSIASLPQTIGDNLGKWIAEGTVATVSMLPDLVTNIIDAILDPNTWKGIGKDMGESFSAEFFAKMTGASGSESTGMKALKGALGVLTGGLSGSVINAVKKYDTGTTYVSQTGMAMVHAGERITASSGAESGTQAARTHGGMGGPTINVYGPVMGSHDEVARYLRRAVGRGLNYGTG